MLGTLILLLLDYQKWGKCLKVLNQNEVSLPQGGAQLCQANTSTCIEVSSEGISSEDFGVIHDAVSKMVNHQVSYLEGLSLIIRANAEGSLEKYMENFKSALNK